MIDFEADTKPFLINGVNDKCYKNNKSYVLVHREVKLKCNISSEWYRFLYNSNVDTVNER